MNHREKISGNLAYVTRNFSGNSAYVTRNFSGNSAYVTRNFSHAPSIQMAVSGFFGESIEHDGRIYFDLGTTSECPWLRHS